MTDNHRQADQWEELVLPDSGIKIEVRPVSVVAMRKLSTSMPQPEVPTRTVKYELEDREEPNPSNPDYLAALASYYDRVGMLSLRFIVRMGVRCEIDQGRLQQLKEAMTELGSPLDDKDDMFNYVTMVACASDGDIRALQSRVMRRSGPTKEATAESEDRFPSKV